MSRTRTPDPNARPTVSALSAAGDVRIVPAAFFQDVEYAHEGVPLSALAPNKKHPRDDWDVVDEDLQILAVTMSDGFFGQVEEVVCTPLQKHDPLRDHGYEYLIVDGHRRVRAAQQAGIQTLRVKIVTMAGRPFTTFACLAYVLTATNSQKPLTKAQQIRGYVRLVYERDLLESTGGPDSTPLRLPSQSQIARMLGVERSTVTSALRILQAPEQVRNALRTGLLPEAHALALIRAIDDPEQINTMVQDILLLNAERKERKRPLMTIEEIRSLARRHPLAAESKSSPDSERAGDGNAANGVAGKIGYDRLASQSSPARLISLSPLLISSGGRSAPARHVFSERLYTAHILNEAREGLVPFDQLITALVRDLDLVFEAAIEQNQVLPKDWHRVRQAVRKADVVVNMRRMDAGW